MGVDDLKDTLEGQAHRSKVKVTMTKDVIFGLILLSYRWYVSWSKIT